jgi:hypothetical protein
MNDIALISLAFLASVSILQGCLLIGIKQRQEEDYIYFKQRVTGIEDELWERYEVAGDVDNLLPQQAGSPGDSQMAPAAGVWGNSPGGEG